MPFPLRAALFGCLVVLTSWSRLQAACASTVMMGHLLDSYFFCDDDGRSVGYAYQLSAPVSVNTGALKITCDGESDAAGYMCGPSAGTFFDGRLTISTDWSLDGRFPSPRVSA